MKQAYTEWLKRPESERNAEAATVVIWWVGFTGEPWVLVNEFSPCTDRNATDLLLAEVKRKGLHAQFRFDDALAAYLGDSKVQDMMWLDWLLLPASLLTWAAVTACKVATDPEEEMEVADDAALKEGDHGSD